MAISFTNLTKGEDSDGGTSATTASISPTSNNLLLATVVNRRSDSVDPTVPSLSGNSLTWVQVASIVFDTTSTSRRRITTFRALGASPSAGSVTITFGEATPQSLWSIEQVSGIDTSGTNGSGAIVQSATNKDESASTSVLTVTLGAFSSVDNATFGAFGNYGITAGSGTPGTGFTEITDLNQSANGIHLSTEYKTTNDTSVDYDFTENSQMGGIAVEIKIAASATTTRLLSLLGVGS